MDISDVASNDDVDDDIIMMVIAMVTVLTMMVTVIINIDIGKYCMVNINDDDGNHCYNDYTDYHYNNDYTITSLCVLCLKVARWSRLWHFIHDSEENACSDIIIDQNCDKDSHFSSPVNAFLMERCILKVHLPNGGFNMVKYGDATDIKVRVFVL